MTPSYEPNLDLFPNMKSATLAARMLTIDGFPAIAEQGEVRGETRYVLASMCPTGYHRAISTLAMLGAFLPDTEIDLVLARVKESIPPFVHTISDENRKRSRNLLAQTLRAIVFDGPENVTGDNRQGDSPEFRNLADQYDNWKTGN